PLAMKRIPGRQTYVAGKRKKPTNLVGFFVLFDVSVSRHSDGRYILSLWPFRSLSFSERDPLPFLKLVEGHPLKILRVEKQILGLSGADESKALVHQFLDRSLCHYMHVLKRFLRGDGRDKLFRRLHLTSLMLAVR